MNSRYYDPITYRFINADDASVTLMDTSSFSNKNLYAYCDNNPLIREDENGDSWALIIKVGINVVLNVCTDLMIAEARGKLDEYNYKSLAMSVLTGVVNGIFEEKWLAILAEGVLNYCVAQSEESCTDAVMIGIISGVGAALGTGNIYSAIGINIDDILDEIMVSLLNVPAALFTTTANEEYSNYIKQKKDSNIYLTSTNNNTNVTSNRTIGKYGMFA